MDEENRYNPQKSWTRTAGEQQDNDPLEKTLFFTRLRQTGKKADFITFQLRGQRFHSIAGSLVFQIEYQPGKGIMIFWDKGTVHIEGRNLEMLHLNLLAGRVTEIREVGEKKEMFFTPESLVVTKIHCESDNLKNLGW